MKNIFPRVAWENLPFRRIFFVLMWKAAAEVKISGQEDKAMRIVWKQMIRTQPGAMAKGDQDESSSHPLFLHTGGHSWWILSWPFDDTKMMDMEKKHTNILQRKLVKQIMNLSTFLPLGHCLWTNVVIKIIFTIITKKHWRNLCFISPTYARELQLKAFDLESNRRGKKICLQIKDLEQIRFVVRLT